MATVFSPPERPEQRVILHDVRWETYEHLLEDFVDRSAPRLTYDRGMLEIMSPLPEHEEYNRALAQLVEVVAEEWGLSIRNLGSATFKRADLAQGFEPDSCFYIQNAAHIRGRRRIDLRTDPPPDLVIEIDVTYPSLDKFPIFARVGIPEIWRYDGERLAIFTREGIDYAERDDSLALPGLDRTTLQRFAEESASQERLEWLRAVRDWARRHAPAGDG